MAQPVRKVIQDLHPEVNEHSFYTLLIDGNNLLRQAFADKKMNPDGKHYGAVFQFFLQIKLLLKKKQYDYIYVTFDDEKSGILRYELYSEYKANRGKKYGEMAMQGEYGKAFEERLKKMQKYIYSKNRKQPKISDSEKFINENFERERDIIIDMCEELCIRTIFNDKTEGDDIIAYYVNNKAPNEKIVIVSTDNDLSQLISDDVCVYNRTLGAYLSKDRFLKIKGYPVENVVIRKILLGDSSDNIGNIYGLSEKRLIEAIPEIQYLPLTIDDVKNKIQEQINERISNKKKPFAWQENVINGVSNKEYDGDFYEINRKLIDLKSPLLTEDAIEDINNLRYQPIDTTDRSFENLYKIVKEEKMTEIMDSNRFASFFKEFKPLMDIEIQRFKKCIK